MKKYDFLIVGSGLFGSVCAYLLKQQGFNVLVIEKRNHVGGNIFTNNQFGINVHMYGAHIFHTSNERVWSFVNKFCRFNDFINTPLANYNGKLYHLPFNMNTFVELWDDVKTIDEAKQKIKSDRILFNKPKNLEEQALSLAGKTIYKKLIKEYTEKQWGRDCSQLPPWIIKRVPLRFEFNNNYFDDKYQGIPMGGYTDIINKLLLGIDIKTNMPFSKDYLLLAETTIYTGPIDEFFDYCFGHLEYRSLKFEHKVFETTDYQGNAVINYTSKNVPYTRTIEHRHFDSNQKSDKTIVTFEYPENWVFGKEPYYPINNDKNNLLYKKYFDLAKTIKGIYFGGRLGMYQYLDMDDTIEAAFKLVERILSNEQ